MSRELSPIQERRPADMQEFIDHRFQQLQAEVEPPLGYAHHGTKNAYAFNPATSSSSLITLLQHERADPLHVLDVGTGVGFFIARNSWKWHDTVHGITAHDYRDFRYYGRLVSPSLDDAYKIGDAENIGQIPGLLPAYDLVISRWMLCHLVDPVGTFEQMADRVAPGGILAVDWFDWETPAGDNSANFAAILEALDDAGYDLATSFQTPEYGHKLVENFENAASIDLVLRRQHADRPVRIPFEVNLAFDGCGRAAGQYALL